MKSNTQAGASKKIDLPVGGDSVFLLGQFSLANVGQFQLALKDCRNNLFLPKKKVLSQKILMGKTSSSLVNFSRDRQTKLFEKRSFQIFLKIELLFLNHSHYLNPGKGDLC